MKVANMEKLVDDVAQIAYSKACEVVADTVREETRKVDICHCQIYFGNLQKLLPK